MDASLNDPKTLRVGVGRISYFRCLFITFFYVRMLLKSITNICHKNQLSRKFHCHKMSQQVQLYNKILLVTEVVTKLCFRHEEMLKIFVFDVSKKSHIKVIYIYIYMRNKNY